MTRPACSCPPPASSITNPGPPSPSPAPAADRARPCPWQTGGPCTRRWPKARCLSRAAPAGLRNALCPVPGRGLYQPQLSKTQNGIELGWQGGAAGGDYRSGFLTRLTTALGGKAAQSAAFTSEVPQIFRGDARVPNIDLIGAGRKSRLNSDDNRAIESMYQHTDLHASVAEGQRIMGAAREEIEAEMQAASGNAVSADKLEQEVRRIARFMVDRYNLGFVDVGGWDTHVGQGAASGLLANRLGQLGRALAAYADAMGPAWKQTTVVVISEFGRTFRENGNKGTDHGHGTVYWVMGGNDASGRTASVGRRQVEEGQARYAVPGPRLSRAQ